MRTRSVAYEELWGRALPHAKWKHRVVHDLQDHTTYSIDAIIDMLDIARAQQGSKISDASNFLRNIEAILDYLSRIGEAPDKKLTYEKWAKKFWINKKYIPCHILFLNLEMRYSKTHEFFEASLKKIRESYGLGVSMQQAINDIWINSEKKRWYPEITNIEKYTSMLEYYALRYFWEPLFTFVNQE